MDTSITLPDSPIQKPANKLTPEHWWNNAILRSIAITSWVIALLALAVVSVVIRNHLVSWPIELAFTRTVQSLFYGSWITPFLNFFGTFNNPTPSGIVLGIVFAGILFMGWYRQAIFLALVVAVGNGIETVIGNYVARPRPSPLLVHVDVILKYNSFPSGHVNHETLFYGFLLFLSFTRPVRTWRYHWALIPLQVFAALNILLIGLSRVQEGEHWLFDVLGGYLCGALWLALFIFLYQWTTSVLEKRRAKKEVMMVSQQQQVVTKPTREKSLETVQEVEQKAKPYEELFIKCKDDWIHHLAQALAFSSLMAFVPNTILAFAVSDLILGKLDTQTWHVLIGGLLANTSSPLSSPLTQILSNAYGTLAHASVVAVLFTIVLAVLLGSFFFSLMETCFDVIYHLPPRPFLRRHLISIGLLFVFFVLTPINVVVSFAPTYLLSLIYVVSPGNLPESNLIFRLAGIVGSTIISLFLFEAIYVIIAQRHITFRNLGRHMRNSWRGALMATIAIQLFLQLFPIYTTRFLGSYIGEVGFVLILLLFIYVSALILFFGAEVNAFFAEGIRVPKNDLITQASRDDR